MSRNGRPPVLNEIKKAEILAVLATGCSRQSAANYVGCDLKTIYNTALRDPEFAEKLIQRESSVEIAHLANLNKAAKETHYWRASAWILERLFPDRFGNRAPDTITMEQCSRFISSLTHMMVEEVPVARYRKSILKRLDRMLAEMPGNLDKHYQRRKKAAEKNPVFSRNSPSGVLQLTEIPQNPLVKPEGNSPLP